jgi:general secretion pathway protein K
MPQQMPTRREAQTGAAILMAMLIMALCTVIITGLFWRQHVTIRSVENRLALSQTRWIERASIDWARVILREDARNSTVDHLGEVWALPVAETKMDETVTGGAKIDTATAGASLSGQVVDAQSKLNLKNLLNDGVPNQIEVAAFQQLLKLLDLNPKLAEAVVSYQQNTIPKLVDGKTIAPSELPLKRVADLSRIAGFDPAVIGMLEPFLIVLPQRTKVNINTTSAEIVSARVPQMSLPAAKAFVAYRDKNFFKAVTEATTQLQGQTLSPELWSVDTKYFLVRGVVKYDRVESRSDTLLERKQGASQARPVDVIWQERY